MSRTIILTPYEHGFLAALDHYYNKGHMADEKIKFDIPNILFSSLTMAGVDSISSMGSIQNSKTVLVKKITSQAPVKKWSDVYEKTKSILLPFKEGLTNKKQISELDEIKHKLDQLLFALKTNSGIITFSNFTDIQSKELLPLDIQIPFEILLKNIQLKTANLPILKSEIEKKDIKRLIQILDSKEFKNYKEAQSEIEQSINLTDKTIKTIEKAGKELYKKNIFQMDIQENIIKVIPMSSKIIELFFGKLPGVLTDYASVLITDYLKLYKSIPIYNCEPIINEIRMASLRQKVIRFVESKNEENKEKGIR